MGGNKERERKREGEREKEGRRERERGEEREIKETERKREGERDKRERCPELLFLLLKGMTGALAPFSYLVYNTQKNVTLSIEVWLRWVSHFFFILRLVVFCQMSFC